jgi:hypothetical protein
VREYDDNDQPVYDYTPMPRIGPNYNQPRNDRYYGGGGNEASGEVSGFKRALGGGGRRRREY